ncbi:MAG: cell division/cell wall cluster transcriptional repressor MraZ [Candidatus Doudnabacteria bacterium RIFCSPHIGHO2_01_FULL_50_11]|uniref:Transcriptional regulator MraZ n=1 Tax=Candidatus Doudnabacteria bacterium RIFCSPHIGHO2_01_FULL_50_11 TaxID=1817828 RepID=A0A1F5PM98_9BACT|nr:MAG: cell division/cell wall cluster transcriptional repressor MraZ [Candidatus Doudnabacteria bacterium RIFCSPHIGHO2_01_FULL_50_11]HLC45084.1 division/cell wall cluster transcriptional repressor MraZ [Patescibacteria group bacterium]
MLIGEFRHSLDAKKRVAIPAKMRKDLGEQAVITRGLDSCLFVYPQAEWAKLVEKLSQLPMGTLSTRSFVRFLLSGAQEASLDQLGRILIPEYLRGYANLGKTVVVVGVHPRIEIWDAAIWDQFKSKAEGNADELAEKLGELGVY